MIEWNFLRIKLSLNSCLFCTQNLHCDFSLWGAVKQKIILTLVKTSRKTLFRIVGVGLGLLQWGFIVGKGDWA